ncbi:MAG TPA: hypothetical protein VFU06_11870 [Longimicrobiales bacterium]|nr:hypothetical protein [Longimicrobiales bacterium]
MTKDDEKFTEFLHELLEEMPDVPEPPREAMWARIEEARRERRAQASLFRRRGPLLGWGIGLAAMLALGIGLGQLLPQSDGDAEPVARSTPAPSMSDAEMLPYRLAAQQHMTRTEALLTGYVRDVQSGRTREVANWAQDLLINTRLLRDSPAARDPETARLLEDLELHLAQIANLSGSDAEELGMIQQSIERNNMLLRLRAATASGPAAGIQGE